MSATLVLGRAAKGWVDRYRAYEVMVNGELREEIRSGGKIVIEVSPGEVELYLKIDWRRSRVLQFVLADGQEASVYCWPRSIISALYGIAFARDNYVRIERTASGGS